MSFAWSNPMACSLLSCGSVRFILCISHECTLRSSSARGSYHWTSCELLLYWFQCSPHYHTLSFVHPAVFFNRVSSRSHHTWSWIPRRLGFISVILLGMSYVSYRYELICFEVLKCTQESDPTRWPELGSSLQWMSRKLGLHSIFSTKWNVRV